MKGAIAAGSLQTAETGATVLKAGGNAVDAIFAAALSCAVSEPTLTSLAGGGVLLYRCGKTKKVTICDFFANAPAKRVENSDRDALDFYGVDLDFGPATQRFHIGAASAAVPGVIPGLFSTQERWGKLSAKEAANPACDLLKKGIEIGPWQSNAAKLLTPFLTSTPKAKAQFAPSGDTLVKGESYALPQLAETVEALISEGWHRYYHSVIVDEILSSHGKRSGGLLTKEDFDHYRVEYRKPLSIDYRGHQVFTNSPPAAGGELILLLLSLLEAISMDAISVQEKERALCHAMGICEIARSQGEPLKKRKKWVDAFIATLDQDLPSHQKEKEGPPSTTHISVVDEGGNAAALTFSYGEGNGIMIGNRGIMMNNLMGEEDLFPSGFFSWPEKTRLATMMSPTLVEKNEKIWVMGTGGANRIRTALPQVISKLIDDGASLKDAVIAARLHFEAGVLNAETFDDHKKALRLEKLDPDELILFEEPNLFFGGVHLVCLENGKIGGFGDPRRAGCSLVV